MFPIPLMGLLGMGALGGALMNKKDPLKGALLGAGMGAAGGALAPSMGGLFGGITAAPTTASIAGAQLPTGGFLGEGIASGVPGWDSAASGGLFGNLKQVGETLKPVGDAAGAAMQVQGMFAQPQQPMAPAPMAQNSSGGQVLASIAQQGAQAAQTEADASEKRKQRRYGLLGVA